MFYLTTHSTHFIYGYMASDIWLRTILIVRNETRCRHIGYSYRLTARVLLYAPSHRQDNTYHGLCYTSRGALAGTRNSLDQYGGIAQKKEHCKAMDQYGGIVLKKEHCKTMDQYEDFVLKKKHCKTMDQYRDFVLKKEHCKAMDQNGDFVLKKEHCKAMDQYGDFVLKKEHCKATDQQGGIVLIKKQNSSSPFIDVMAFEKSRDDHV